MQIRSLSLTVLLAIVGTACKRQPAPEEQAPAPPSLPPQAVAPATPKADTVGLGWDSPETVRSSGVRYTAPMRIFDALGVTLPDDYFDSLKAKWRLWTGAFAAAGLSLISDSLFAVQAFLAPATILHGSETFRWVSRRCDGDSLKIAFRHPVFQQVRFDGQLL